MFKTLKENSSLTKQTIVLFVSQILSMLLGIILDIINTRLLGLDNFGYYSLIGTVIFSVVLFFDFGIFSSGSRLLALAKDEHEEKNLFGVLFVITLVIGILFGITIFIFSFFVDPFFNSMIGNSLKYISILSIIYPFQSLIPMICRGSNQIIKLSIYTVLPRLIYLLLIAIIIKTSFIEFNFSISFAMFCIAIIISTILIIIQLKPKIDLFKKYYLLLKKETREYGIKIYSGNIFGNISQYLDKILISYFISTNSLGIYSIATRISNPIRLLSNSLSISIFKELAMEKEIKKSIKNLNFIMVLSFALIILAINPFITLIFGKVYFEVTKILPFLVIAMFFGGLSNPYNAFLGAKKKGEYVRNIAIISPMSNIILNLICVPFFGIYGAAYALIISLLVSYFLHVFYYNKTLKELKEIYEK